MSEEKEDVVSVIEFNFLKGRIFEIEQYALDRANSVYKMVVDLKQKINVMEKTLTELKREKEKK